MRPSELIVEYRTQQTQGKTEICGKAKDRPISYIELQRETLDKITVGWKPPFSAVTARV
jgi:hypothetical protein